VRAVCGDFLTLELTLRVAHSMVGALNRIPMVAISFALFQTPVTRDSLISIVFGVTSGVLYAAAKVYKPASLADSPLFNVQKSMEEGHGGISLMLSQHRRHKS
jgi:hypothetical protein